MYWYEADAIHVKRGVIKSVGEDGLAVVELLKDKGGDLVAQQENGFGLQCFQFPLEVGEAFSHFVLEWVAQFVALHGGAFHQIGLVKTQLVQVRRFDAVYQCTRGSGGRKREFFFVGVKLYG